MQQHKTISYNYKVVLTGVQSANSLFQVLRSEISPEHWIKYEYVSINKIRFKSHIHIDFQNISKDAVITDFNHVIKRKSLFQTVKWMKK